MREILLFTQFFVGLGLVAIGLFLLYAVVVVRPVPTSAGMPSGFAIGTGAWFMWQAVHGEYPL